MGIEMAQGESKKRGPDRKTDDSDTTPNTDGEQPKKMRSKTDDSDTTPNTDGEYSRKWKKSRSMNPILFSVHSCPIGFDDSDLLDVKCGSRSVVCRETGGKGPQFFSKDKMTALCINDNQLQTEFNVSCGQ